MERALIRQEISKACKRLALTQQVVTMCELEATPGRRNSSTRCSARNWLTGSACGGNGC